MADEHPPANTPTPERPPPERPTTPGREQMSLWDSLVLILRPDRKRGTDRSR